MPDPVTQVEYRLPTTEQRCAGLWDDMVQARTDYAYRTVYREFRVECGQGSSIGELVLPWQTPQAEPLIPWLRE